MITTERLYIPPTKTSPLVLLDPAMHKGSIMGNSIPENASEFYERINQWLQRNLPMMPGPMYWHFRLHYYNTSSAKGLYQMLRCIKEHMDMQHGHTVVWDVEEHDEFMQEAGEDFIALLGIRMQLRTITEEEAMIEPTDLASMAERLERT